MTLRLKVSAPLALLLALGFGDARALSTDKDQPIEIEADSAELDDSTGVTIYKGNVVVIQGSMRLSGDMLTVNFTAERQMHEAFLDGQPARFKQRPDGMEVDNDGEALRIEFYADQDLLVLKRQAKLTQGDRLFSGPEIVYDTKRSILKASAGATGETGRVKIILPPSKKKAGE